MASGSKCSKLLASHYRANLLLAGRSLERIKPVARELQETCGVKVRLDKGERSIPFRPSSAMQAPD